MTVGEFQSLQPVKEGDRQELLHRIVQHADERDRVAVEGGLSVGGGLYGLGPLAARDVAPGVTIEEVLPTLGSVEGALRLFFDRPVHASCGS